MPSDARCFRDSLLQENLLSCIQSLSDSCHILLDRLVNQTYCAWGDLWDKPVEDEFVWRISIGSVSSYVWIAVWIAFCVIFLWILDCLLNRQFIKSIYRFCQNFRRKSPLACHACNLSLWWWNGAMVIWWNVIHSHIIGDKFGVTSFLFHFCHDSAYSFLNSLIGQWSIVAIIVID